MSIFNLGNRYHNKFHLRINNKIPVSGIPYAFLLPIFMLIGLYGCTPAVYHANLAYQPTGTVTQTPKSGTDNLVTVALANDIRKVDDTLQLGRVITLGGKVVPILPKYRKAAEAVTMNIRSYLSDSGYKVSNDIPNWDLDEKTILTSWGKILVGCNIDELEITGKESFPMTTYRTKVKLTFVFANVPEKKIFYRSSVESSSTLDDVFFSEKILGQQISTAVSNSLTTMFNDPEIRKKMTH